MLCDLSKAFDVIYGFRGIVYNWFENYLTGRRQYVEIEESRSNIYHIECGVPRVQSSDLSYASYMYTTWTCLLLQKYFLLLMALPYTVQITFIFIDFRVCDFAFALKTQNAPCVSRFKRVLFSEKFRFKLKRDVRLICKRV